MIYHRVIFYVMEFAR